MKKADTRLSIIKRRGYRKDIRGDKFSLYISSYPVAIEYLKQRIGNRKKIVAELCCGIGVTLEHIADGFKQVIGVDINNTILNQCRDNLKRVGLSKKSTLFLGDINEDSVLKKIKADVVIYDIPFWSPHENQRHGDLTRVNPTLKSTVKRIRKFITKDIVIFCSSKYTHQTIRNELGPCEFQKVFVNGKHDRNYIYFGSLKRKSGVSVIKLST